MTCTLKITCTDEPGTLQRVLVTVSRRGFEPVGIVGRLQGSRFDLDLSLEGLRPIPPLVAHLQRLVAVLGVEVVR